MARGEGDYQYDPGGGGFPGDLDPGGGGGYPLPDAGYGGYGGYDGYDGYDGTYGTYSRAVCAVSSLDLASGGGLTASSQGYVSSHSLTPTPPGLGPIDYDAFRNAFAEPEPELPLVPVLVETGYVAVDAHVDLFGKSLQARGL